MDRVTASFICSGRTGSGAALFPPAPSESSPLNLLSNALKFTPEGGRIDVGVGLHGEVAEVSVADTGIGIIVRRGTGRLCDVCGKTIEKHSIERVVQGPRGTSALTHENW